MPPEREKTLPSFVPPGASVIDLPNRRNHGGILPPRINSVSPPPSGAETKPPSTGFAAQIEGASIADLIQMECLRGSTRCLRVRSHGRSGVLCFEGGDLIRASAEGHEGKRAALIILSWEEGTVASTNVNLHGSPRIETSWQGLLLAAAQIEDEQIHDLAETSFDDEESTRCPITSRRPSAPHSYEALTPREGTSEAETLRVEDQKGSHKVDILRAIRLGKEGEVVQQEGEVGDFADATSYALRLIQLIGDGLGLDPFVGLECTSEDKVMICYAESDTIVALEASPKADLRGYRQKSGT